MITWWRLPLRKEEVPEWVVNGRRPGPATG
jgi:hypothetical protein